MINVIGSWRTHLWRRGFFRSVETFVGHGHDSEILECLVLFFMLIPC